MKKREFIKSVALTAAALPLTGFGIEPKKHETDFKFNGDWSKIRKMYQLRPHVINLENGYYNILPTPILEAQIEHVKGLNYLGSYYMRKNMSTDREASRKALADFLNVQLEELIITRNTTESLDTIISGFPWNAGDEVILANQEYGSMVDMFKQVSKRHQIKLNYLDIPLHPKSDEEIIQLYENRINEKTKMILVSHIVFLTGHVLPIKKICEMAAKHGVKVMVDGAHAIGHLDFKISDLNCDYYAASLHKWLCVPLGAGMLYIKKGNVKELWPLFGDSAYADDDIRKLNHTGTTPVHVEMTIPYAIKFYQSIGAKNKEDRLRFLQKYWTSAVRQIDGITVNTPEEDSRNCGIANVGKVGISPLDLAEKLLKFCDIWTVGIDFAGVSGVRIVPNVYTTTEELDKLISALKKLK